MTYEVETFMFKGKPIRIYLGETRLTVLRDICAILNVYTKEGDETYFSNTTTVVEYLNDRNVVTGDILVPCVNGMRRQSVYMVTDSGVAEVAAKSVIGEEFLEWYEKTLNPPTCEEPAPRCPFDLSEIDPAEMDRFTNMARNLPGLSDCLNGLEELADDSGVPTTATSRMIVSCIFLGTDAYRDAIQVLKYGVSCGGRA